MVTTSKARTASHGGRSGIVVDGLDLMVASFLREAVTAAPKAGAASVKAATKAAERMRNNVPIGPPRLHVLNSITADQTPMVEGAGKVYADAGPDSRADEGAFVARFLEHGTVHMPPQPFVGPAGDETLSEFVDDMKRLPSL